MKFDWNHFFFYPENHEFAGGLRGWIGGILVLALVLAGGYLEGLEHAQYLGK